MMTSCPRRALRFCVLAAALGANSAGAWQMKQAPLMTRWAALVDTNAPLPEYPRPQLVRTDWMNLNGIWQFQPGASNDPVPINQTLASEILVPYPMESALSGVMQYSEWSWYRRTFAVPAGWSGRHVILHLDAVNWQAQVFVNGHSVGTHKGGYDPFGYDITSYLSGSGPQELIVQVYSPEDNAGEPRGKQTLYPGGIMYTSSSGIWQPAWLEPVDAAGVSNLLIVPDVDNGRLRLTVNTYASNGVTANVTVLDGAQPVAVTSGPADTELDVALPHAKLWSPDDPFLYGLNIVLTHNGATNDVVASYFGMRKISTAVVNGTPRIFLNNQMIFGIGPLDQGFWPDGIYTAPTDDALKSDLAMEKELGFNQVRKHIKVERQRWYYWADTLGLMVWQDMPSCNSYTGNPSPPAVDPVDFEDELSAMVQTHINSPSIIMWDIFNEGQGEQGSGNGVGQASTASLVALVKGLDPSRLVNQASGGNYFGVGDVFDNHSYPAPGDPTSSTQAPVDGEYGGIGYQWAGHLWNPSLADGDYIPAPSLAGIAPIYDLFIDDLLAYKPGGLNGAIYTQITDVENECNGLMAYDRYLKPDPSLIAYSNEKAITGQLNVITIVPTSQNQSLTWKYTTNSSVASTDWYATNYNDSGWSSGPAPFGQGDPGVATSWTSGDIWIRRQFTLGGLTPQESNDLSFSVYHDEDCEIYINGVLAASATGYTTSYVPLAFNAAGKTALKQNAQNLIAIHCHQTSGGQEIDAGIAAVDLIANTLTVPTDEIGWWKLDETSGTIAHDSSGSGDNGAITGSPSWNPEGKVNGCLSFNGTFGYAQAARDVSNDFSIAFWVKTTANQGSGAWYEGLGLVDAYSSGFGVSMVGSNLAFGVRQTSVYSTNAIDDGNWHYCTATRIQATGAMALYVDGVLQATAVGVTNSLTNASVMNFGAYTFQGGLFTGALDEIKVFNRALGDLEVAALYGDVAAPPGAPTNLTATTSGTQVTLNWWSVPLASSYEVSRATSPGGPYTFRANVSTPGYTDTQVTSGQTYYYIVSSIDSAGAGPGSAAVVARPYTLAAWFRADALKGLANGARVGDWPDSSGLGNDATQSNPSQQPTFLADAFNGQPAVHFNGTNNTYLSFNRVAQDDFTIACVFRSAQGLNSGAYYYQGAGLVNAEVANVVPDFGSCLFANGQICAGTGDPDVAVSSAPGYNDGQPHEFIFERVESSGTVSLWVDGALAGTTTGGTEPLTAPSVMVMGAQQTLLYFLTGDIAEVRVYDITLSGAERSALDTLLRVKYLDLPAPTLAAALTHGALTFSWPAASGFSLYTTTNLTPPVVWSPLTNAPSANAGTNSVTLAPTDASRFFELLGP